MRNSVIQALLFVAIAASETLSQDIPTARKITPRHTVTPRTTVSAVLKLAKGNSTADAEQFILPSLVDQRNRLTEVPDLNTIGPLHLVQTATTAIVWTNSFPDKNDQLQVLSMVLKLHDGRWMVCQYEFTAPAEALRFVEGFQLHPEAKIDVICAELVGKWRVNVCESSLILNADGTGSELAEGPAGPAPDAVPEAFQWNVSGQWLLRQFQDRYDRIKIVSVSHSDVRSISVNSGRVIGWHRPGRHPAPFLKRH